jgi:hypothetical protein
MARQYQWRKRHGRSNQHGVLAMWRGNGVACVKNNVAA